MAFLRCTVVDAETGAAHDVEISFDPETTVASLLAALPVDVAGRPVFAGPVRLDPDGTIGDGPLIVGCVLSIGAPDPDLRQLPRDVAGALRVLAGPDAGSWAWVPAGSGALVGRGDQVDLVLTDPQSSRPHAEVVAAEPGDALVRDLDSANGTTVGGVPVDGPTRVPANGCFEIGGTQIQWIPLDRVDHRWRRAADGRLEFTRRFHSAPVPAPATVQLPAAPAEPTRGTMMLITSTGAPLVLGVAMFAATGSAPVPADLAADAVHRRVAALPGAPPAPERAGPIRRRTGPGRHRDRRRRHHPGTDPAAERPRRAVAHAVRSRRAAPALDQAAGRAGRAHRAGRHPGRAGRRAVAGRALGPAGDADAAGGSGDRRPADHRGARRGRRPADGRGPGPLAAGAAGHPAIPGGSRPGRAEQHQR